MIDVTLLGGAKEIGASSALLEVNDIGIVIDAGARPKVRGPKALPAEFESLDQWDGVSEHPLSKVRAVLLTHAHGDHTGALPILHRAFPQAPIFATGPTIRIAETLLADSLSIQERDEEITPMWNAEDLKSLARSFVDAPFGSSVLIASSEQARVCATFVRAGHILGAAMILVEVEDFVEGKKARILFGGDVSLFDQPTIEGLDLQGVLACRPHLMLMEGTYGDEERGDYSLEEARFVRDVAEVLNRGGRVVIPAFAVGRAQNVIVILRRAMRDPRPFQKVLGDPSFYLPRVPIHLDGMCRTVAEHFSTFRGLLHPDLVEEERKEKHVFFDEDGLVNCVTSLEERRKISETEERWIAVSSSGMVTGGAVQKYVKAIADDPRSSVFLTGYVDEESVGSAMLRMRSRNGKPGFVYLEGEKVTLHCKIDQYRLGAHSDAKDFETLMAAVDPMDLRLVHGDEDRLGRLASRLRKFAKRKRLSTQIAIAEAKTRIRVEGERLTVSRRFSHAAYPAAADSWAVQRLTGKDVTDNIEKLGATRAVTSALRHGWSFGLTTVDVARLRSFLPDHRPVDRAEVDRTAAELSNSIGRAWDVRRTGPATWMYTPFRTRQSFHDMFGSIRGDFSVRQQRSDLGEYWDRVDAAGIKIGDLVLCADGPHIVPAILLDKLSWGYRILSPNGGQSQVNVANVWARVGPWAFLSDGDYSADTRFLMKLRDLIADYAVEYTSVELSSDSLDPMAIVSRLSEMATNNEIDMAVWHWGSRLVNWDRNREGLTLSQIVDRQGAELSSADAKALEGLLSLGLIHRKTHVVDGREEELIFWGQEATARSTNASRTLESVLGEEMAKLILEAYHAASEVRRERAQKDPSVDPNRVARPARANGERRSKRRLVKRPSQIPQRGAA